MERIINPCYHGNKDVFIKIEYTGERLSITGVINPTPKGNAYSAGQILDVLLDSDNDLKDNWTPEMIHNLYMAWKNWHLNDLRAGCKHQRDLKWEDVRIDPKELPHTIANRDERGILAIWISEKEHTKGLLSKPCPVCGYEYGTKWLFEEVPEDVIEFLFSLPETQIQPAWI